MALFHFHTKNFNRTKSALGVAAYRSGTKLKDFEHNRTYNYTKKQHVEYTTLLFPKGVKEMTREEFWNKAQAVEKQADGRYAKELEFSLPRELDRERQIEIARDFLIRNFVDKGYTVDMNVHVPPAADGEEQPHVHALIAVRKLNGKGEFEKTKERKEYALDQDGNRIPLLDTDGNQRIGKKGRRLWKRVRVQANDLDSREVLAEWREDWQDTLNAVLPDGITVSCKTLEDQGINRVPTVHEGFVARRIAKRGGMSYRIEKNKQIKQLNERIKQLETEIVELERQEEREKAEKTESEKEKLQKERSDHRAEMAAYDFLKEAGTDMTDWLAVWQASDKLASSDNRIDGLYELSQKGMRSYDINDYAGTHDLKDAKWLQKSLVFYKAGATKLRQTAYDAMTAQDKATVDDELRKRADAEALKQKPEEGFTAAPPQNRGNRGNSTVYEMKRALTQIDRNLNNDKEKNRAMRDYERAQEAVEREQKRMQHRDDWDFD